MIQITNPLTLLVVANPLLMNKPITVLINKQPAVDRVEVEVEAEDVADH